MKLIKFKSLEKVNYTKYKEMDVDNTINGKVYNEKIKTGIPESIRTEYKTYWIPIDKIDILVSFDRKWTINNIQVSEEEFERVKLELINYEENRN